MNETEKKVVDIVNERIVDGRSEYAPETLVKAHNGINLIVAKDLIRGNVAELETSMEFSEEGKRYKMNFSMSIEELDK